MIVVTIIAMISGAVAVMATKHAASARLKQAGTDARTLRLAALGAETMQVVEGCPTVERLRAERVLDKASASVDPWGEPFVIACADEEVTVTSAGPDRRLGSPDDITVP